MKRFLIGLVSSMLMFCMCGFAQATVIDFTADGFRPNDAGIYPTMTENSSQTGFDANTPLAGQKVSYGTEFFNGRTLSEISTIEFTFMNSTNNSPYSNLCITNGTYYGMISSQGDYFTNIIDNRVDTNPTYQATATYYFSDRSKNNGFKFYEPSANGYWEHAQNISWDDIKDWTILGVDDTRPLNYLGEGANPRAPLTTGLNLIWGDSAANYLGSKHVMDVKVTGTNGTVYTAGPVPEPATMLLLGFGLLGIAGVSRKKN